MRERPLSASSIKTYLQCLLKYYYRYEDKKPRPGKSDPLAFGIAIHEALEYMQKVVLETGQPPDAALYDKVLGVFMSSATENGLSDMPTYSEGRTLLLGRLDNVDPKEKVLGLELRFHLNTPAGTPFTGSIDKLIELDDETAVIIDYKTSRMALSQDEADSDIQLSMYDLAVSMLHPQYKTIVCAFDYLRLAEVVTHRTPEQRQIFVEFLDAIYSNIRNTNPEDVQANINTFCPWCECKDFCPGYREVVTDPALVLPMLGETTNEDFVAAWDQISAAKRIVDARQREFKAEAYERMKQNETIRGGGRELYKTQSSRMSYDPQTIFEVAGEREFMKMASVGKTAVDRFLKNNPEHSEEAERTASFSFLSPFFKTRKVK